LRKFDILEFALDSIIRGPSKYRTHKNILNGVLLRRSGFHFRILLFRIFLSFLARVERKLRWPAPHTGFLLRASLLSVSNLIWNLKRMYCSVLLLRADYRTPLQVVIQNPELPDPWPRFVHLGISAQSPMDLTFPQPRLSLRRRLNFFGGMKRKRSHHLNLNPPPNLVFVDSFHRFHQ
jgi:hypothetical protein